jgi:hypothetical protein
MMKAGQRTRPLMGEHIRDRAQTWHHLKTIAELSARLLEVRLYGTKEGERLP